MIFKVLKQTHMCYILIGFEFKSTPQAKLSVQWQHYLQTSHVFSNIAKTAPPSRTPATLSNPADFYPLNLTIKLLSVTYLKKDKGNALSHFITVIKQCEKKKFL